MDLKRQYKQAKKAHAAAPSDSALKKAYKAAKLAYKAASAAAAKEEEEHTSAPSFSNKRKSSSNDVPAMAVRPLKKAKGSCSRCFVGNLPFAITEAKLREFFKTGGAGEVEDIYWVTDKETQKFYGSSFVTFFSPEGAEHAVTLTKQRCMGRPLRVELCPPKASSLGSKNAPKERKIQVQVKTELSDKPENCTTVYLGNLNYNVKDEHVHEFFKDCGTITNIRWLTHRDTGNFKGAGYVNFTETHEVDAAVKKNACIFMGRPLRIDYAESRSDGTGN